MNRSVTFPVTLFFCLTSLAFVNAAGTQSKSTPHSKPHRTFAFHYKASINDLAGDGVVRVWIPLASSSDAQKVDVQSATESLRETKDPKYGNRMLYGEFSAKQDIDISINYIVNRREVRALDQKPNDQQNSGQSAKPSNPKELSVFLTANQQVPISGKPLSLLPTFGISKSTTDRARQIYNQVDSLVKYDKSKPGYGNGDVLWVCDSRTGNCTDFHSLFISMARSQSIPAKFEIGFPIPSESSGKIGGYHCWAAFYDQDRWIPVDISEADKHPEMKEYYFGNLTADRVQFSTGRDIVLEPPQQGVPLNYFVYPYAEVDGKPVPREQIHLDFSYRDLNGEHKTDK